MARKQKAVEEATEQQAPQAQDTANLTLSNPSELTVKKREPQVVQSGRFIIINH